MPARKKAQQPPAEANLGSPDLSIPPTPAPTRKPKALEDKVEALISDALKIIADPDFPQEMKGDVEQAILKFKVVLFKTKAAQ